MLLNSKSNYKGPPWPRHIASAYIANMFTGMIHVENPDTKGVPYCKVDLEDGMRYRFFPYDLDFRVCVKCKKKANK